jgi:hypothetical protein
MSGRLSSPHLDMTTAVKRLAALSMMQLTRAPRQQAARPAAEGVAGAATAAAGSLGQQQAPAGGGGLQHWLDRLAGSATIATGAFIEQVGHPSAAD